MNPRIKWLVVAAAAVFGLYFLDTTYRSWIEQPTQVANSQLDSIAEKLRKSKEDQLLAQKQSKRLEAYAARSLPSDPQLARSLYQEWLLNLVETHQLTSASVDPSLPTPIEISSRTKKGKKQLIGHRMNYSVRGQANLSKLAGFLDAFRKAGHLHKIRSLTLNPIGNEGRLDANLAIEVLCLEASANKNQLSDWQMDDEAAQALGSFEPFVRRNLFARGFAKALFDIELKAITQNRQGRSEAWFRIDGRGTTKTVAAGAQVPVALHDISVVEVLPDKVLLNVNQDIHWIKLGQTVGEVCSPGDSKP